jgi:hypothetical protein
MRACFVVFRPLKPLNTTYNGIVNVIAAIFFKLSNHSPLFNFSMDYQLFFLSTQLPVVGSCTVQVGFQMGGTIVFESIGVSSPGNIFSTSFNTPEPIADVMLLDSNGDVIAQITGMIPNGGWQMQQMVSNSGLGTPFWIIYNPSLSTIVIIDDNTTTVMGLGKVKNSNKLSASLAAVEGELADLTNERNNSAESELGTRRS